jgi:hypothetical protein
MSANPQRWAIVAAVAALGIVLLVETVLVVETFPTRYGDRDPPSRWSQTMKELFGRY